VTVSFVKVKPRPILIGEGSPFSDVLHPQSISFPILISLLIYTMVLTSDAPTRLLARLGLVIMRITIIMMPRTIALSCGVPLYR